MDAVWLRWLLILLGSAIVGVIFGRGVYRYRRSTTHPEVPAEEVYFWILQHDRLKPAILMGIGMFIFSLTVLYAIFIWM